MKMCIRICYAVKNVQILRGCLRTLIKQNYKTGCHLKTSLPDTTKILIQFVI